MNKRLLAAGIILPCWLLIAPFLFTEWNISAVTFGAGSYTSISVGAIFRMGNALESVGIWFSLVFQGELVGTWGAIGNGDLNFLAGFFMQENNFMSIMVWLVAGFIIAAIVQEWRYSLVLLLGMLGIWLLMTVLFSIPFTAYFPWDGVLLALVCLPVGWSLGIVASGANS